MGHLPHERPKIASEDVERLRERSFELAKIVGQGGRNARIGDLQANLVDWLAVRAWLEEHDRLLDAAYASAIDREAPTQPEIPRLPEDG